MSETPRRKRLQIHLSTAVVLMIAAGILIWANVSERAVKLIVNDGVNDPLLATKLYGSPRDAFFYEFNHEIVLPISVLGVAVDFAAALLILFAVWFVCEWWIRRRAARKGT